MKRFTLSAIMLITGYSLFAQVLTSPPEKDEEFKTIFKGDEIKISAFGGPMMSFSVVDEQFSFFMGGGGGIMLGNFYFGGYGQGLSSSLNVHGNNDEISFGHGGLMFGYTLGRKRAIHPTINLLTGWGNISKVPNTDYDEPYHADNVFVFEPSVQLEINMAQFFKVAIGGGYRLVSGVNETNYGDYIFSGPSVSLCFKFGWFQ